MKYCLNPNSEEPIMLLNRHVGMDEEEGMGIDGALFQSELLQLDEMGKKRIQVWINSPGGIVMDGYNIYTAILKSKTKVDTYCVGIAASIAAVIFQAGRNRYMSDYGQLMYHNPFGGNDSNELAPMTDSIATMIHSRVGKQKEEILAIMKKTTWISASEALMNGFCDEIEVSTEQNKKRATSVKAMWQESNFVLNSMFNINEKPKKMIKVTNKLGLIAEANEDTIVDAIASVVNKAEAAASAMNEMENELKAAKEKCSTLENSLNAMKAEKESAEEAQREAEEKEVEGKVKNMLAAYVTSGRIKADAVDSWTTTSKAIGHDKVKEMLEALPLNKVANKMAPITEVANEMKLTNVAASTMADVRAKMKL